MAHFLKKQPALKVKGIKTVLGFQPFDLSTSFSQNRSCKHVTLGVITGQSSLAIMKPKLTLNTRGFEFSLHELREIIQWIGVWVGFGQGISRTQNPEICSKVNKGNLVRR
jgi:hypothetical protein